MYGIDYTNIRKEKLSMKQKKTLLREKRNTQIEGNFKS